MNIHSLLAFQLPTYWFLSPFISALLILISGLAEVSTLISTAYREGWRFQSQSIWMLQKDLPLNRRFAKRQIERFILNGINPVTVSTQSCIDRK